MTTWRATTAVSLLLWLLFASPLRESLLGRAAHSARDLPDGEEALTVEADGRQDLFFNTGPEKRTVFDLNIGQ
jgi:hypothetical protein